MNAPKDILTTQQAAALMGLSTSSVQKMVSRGELQAWVTPGGHRRIQRDSVQQWLARTAGTPLDDAAAAPVMAEPALRPPREHLQVLLAEDDPTQVDYLRRLFEAHGAEMVLTVAEDASQALILLERQRPDLVVTDLVMQPFDGFHLVRTIVAEPAWRDIAVLVISGLGDEEVASRGGLPAGVTRYPKTVGVERLFGYLDAVFAQHAARARALAG
jgi:excisionase family DNA binding protein